MDAPDGHRPRRTDIARIRAVISRPRYAAVGIVAAAVSFIVYALLLNLSLLITMASNGSYAAIIALVPGLVRTHVLMTPTSGIAMSVLISLAIGVNVALVAFRIAEMASFGTRDASSVGGMAVAILAPACPACATTIFAFAGATSVFAVLPFRGAEFKLLALLLLGVSAVWIARQIDKDTCDV